MNEFALAPSPGYRQLAADSAGKCKQAVKLLQERRRWKLVGSRLERGGGRCVGNAKALIAIVLLVVAAGLLLGFRDY